MRTVVSGPIVHRCPHVDETDIGTVEFTFDGPAIELHALAALVGAYADERITHEDLTAALAAESGARVTTRFRTAGLDVECSA